MENIVLTRGDYVDLLINGQIIFLGRVESTKDGTYNGRERVNMGYVTIFIIDVTQRNLNMEDVMKWTYIHVSSWI